MRVSELTEARDVRSPWEVAVLEEVAGNSEVELRRLVVAVDEKSIWECRLSVCGEIARCCEIKYGVAHHGVLNTIPVDLCSHRSIAHPSSVGHRRCLLLL